MDAELTKEMGVGVLGTISCYCYQNILGMGR